MAFAFFLLQTSSPGSTVGALLPMVAMFAIMYFLLILPMQRQRKRTQSMLSALKAGDQVQTNGGIIGTIVSLQEDSVVIRVKPDNVKLQIARPAVASVIHPEDNK